MNRRNKHFSVLFYKFNIHQKVYYIFVGLQRKLPMKRTKYEKNLFNHISQGYSWNDIVYLNFEDERLAGMELADLNMILEVHAGLSDKRPMLFLDEIQNVEGWEHFARRIAENKFKVGL